jgi:hypothetical protein
MVIIPRVKHEYSAVVVVNEKRVYYPCSRCPHHISMYSGLCGPPDYCELPEHTCSKLEEYKVKWAIKNCLKRY